MASVSASHLIIFVASLVIAAGVVGTLTTGVERVSSSIDDGSLDVSQQIRMDMSVISDSGVEYPNGEQYDDADDDDDVVIHVRNTGSQSVPIDESEFDLVLNGQFLVGGNDDGEFTVEDANDDETVWRPGNVVQITINNPDLNDGNGDNRLFITVNGDEELFEFRAD